jgi:hypothetical protein
MKPLYNLLGGLLLTGMTLHAQTATTNPAAAAAPCSTFESAAASTNWVAETTIGVQFVNTNPLDGSTCVTLYDGPYGTWYSNSIDYTSLGQRFRGKCLCFDYFLIRDGGLGTPFYPTVYLSDGVNTIAFVSSTPVTAGSGWISVCAPIEHCNGALPSNADGSWTIDPSLTCADFNNILDNVKTISFPTDITGSPSEVMSIDNVCVKDCGKGCQIDFDLNTSIKSNGTAVADVFLNYMVINASYSVDWGDGTPPSGPFVSHVYSTPGSYNVCVTMVVRTDDGGIISVCTKCVNFCFGKFYLSGGISDDGGVLSRKEMPKMIMSMQKRKFDNESYLIYPNPSQDQATVEIMLLEKNRVSLRIMDVLGKVVSEASGDYNEGEQKIKLNTEKLPTGVYTVEINFGGRISTQKLSIAR